MFCKVIFGSSLRAMVKQEASSDQYWKEAFYETAFRCLTASHRITRFSSVFSLLTEFSGNLQRDNCERNEACDDKGKILRWKQERSFVTKFLLMCEFISQNYTYVLCRSPLTLSLRNLRRISLDRIEAYADKGNIISSKRAKSFLGNFFVICEFLSRSYSLVLRRQFANTLFVECAKGDLGAHRGPWWKSKYPQIQTGKKPFEKLHFNVWMQLTDLHVSLQCSVC